MMTSTQEYLDSILQHSRSLEMAVHLRILLHMTSSVPGQQ